MADTAHILRAAERIAATHRMGHRVVVVLSAQGHTTDALLQKAREISPAPSKRELDMLLVTGEQQSVALMAMALHKMGASAVSLNASQVGIEAEGLHGNARIRRIRTERMLRGLEQNSIVLVAGFQGVTRFGDLTTLGRGASDTTAVAIAAVLGADICEFFKDVDGVYTADPRVVPTARRLPAISYDEMLELAHMGAQVLHARAVEMAKRYQVPLAVRSNSGTPGGTMINNEGENMEKLYFSGLAIDRDVARISVMGLPDTPGVAFQIFSLLATQRISVDIILQTAHTAPVRDISFTVARQDLPATLLALEDNRHAIGYATISHDTAMAKLSIVGAGMATNPGVAATMFAALYESGVNIALISTSEIKITVLIDKDQADRAAVAIHEKFARELEHDIA